MPRKPEARLIPPDPTPRPIDQREAEILKRMLHLEAEQTELPHLDELLASVDRLTVMEGCDCGCDSLFFDNPRNLGKPIVSCVGRTAGNNEVEVILWARDTTLTFLEIEPWGPTLNPVRLPLAESIAPYPDDAFGCDDSDEGKLSQLSQLERRPISIKNLLPFAHSLLEHFCSFWPQHDRLQNFALNLR